jgi:hypothetical protein
MTQEDEDQDQDDEPPQEEDIDQGEMKMIKTRKMIKRFRIKDHHTRVHQAIQRDHPINSILGDIHKG